MIIDNLFREKTFKDGEIVFRQGEPGTEMYIIRDGNVRVVRDVETGRQEIATLTEGDFFGEMAIFDDLPRSATVQSMGDSTLQVVDRQTVKNGLKSHPEMAVYLLEMMSRRLRRVDEMLESFVNERGEIDSSNVRGPI